jgi:hypothetical protein
MGKEISAERKRLSDKATVLLSRILSPTSDINDPNTAIDALFMP